MATATHKAVQVYENLVVSDLDHIHYETPNIFDKMENPENAPDLVIAGESMSVRH